MLASRGIFPQLARSCLPLAASRCIVLASRLHPTLTARHNNNLTLHAQVWYASWTNPWVPTPMTFKRPIVNFRFIFSPRQMFRPCVCWFIVRFFLVSVFLSIFLSLIRAPPLSHLAGRDFRSSNNNVGPNLAKGWIVRVCQSQGVQVNARGAF